MNYSTPKRSARIRLRTIQLQLETLESRLLLTGKPAFDGITAGELTIDPQLYDPSSILVRYRPDAVDAAKVPGVGEAVGRSFPMLPGLQEIRLRKNVSVNDALRWYRSDSSVLYAEPNFRIQLSATPNDPQFDSLWGLQNVGQTGGTIDVDIDAGEAWDFHSGNSSTVIAVIDTGVDYTHEDLAANMWVNSAEIANDGIDNDGNGYVDDVHGYDFVNDDGDPIDDHDHGTHVAGTIGAVGNNGVGVTGVNWNVQIMALKFLDAAGSGSTADAVAAITYAVVNGAKISNNSWGFNGEFSQTLHDAIEFARDAGHIFVAAAGNGNFLGIGLDNDATPYWPANHDLENVVAVAATDHNDQIATFSNYGATTVDLAAPGVAILSTTIGDTYSTFNGTSMATPHVTGVLGLMLTQYPDWTYDQVIDRLLSSVDPIDALEGNTVTGGRLNAAAAMGPDLAGPFIVATTPSDSIVAPVDTVRVSFSESVDAATFTPDDINNFTGPQGPISASSVVPVPASRGRKFDITFAPQTELGSYSLLIGPDLTDLAGNLMDHDGDGIGGETDDDQFAVEFDLVFAKLDFGKINSPVAAGYQQVTASMVYTSALGYGWLSGTVDSRDRGASAGDELSRDFNFTELATFVVDVPDAGIYDVTLTMGDGAGYARDQMGIFLEGVQIDSVNSSATAMAVNTYTVEVTDGQLTLLLDDLGGSDPYVLLNGLDVTIATPDSSGPSIVGSSPESEHSGTLDRIGVTFDELIDASTFTADDIILSGPNGTIAPTGVNQLTGRDFEIVFDAQSTAGDYTLTLGPDIEDLFGNQMDQDGDGAVGETPEDQYSATITLTPIPFGKHLDFGINGSPVATGYVGVLSSSSYSSAVGHGWLSGTVDSRDRGASAGDELSRDFNFTELATFVVDVPDAGIYDVTLTMGDGAGYARDQMGVFLEGLHIDSINSSATAMAVNTYTVEVADGQLTLLLDDLGGSDLYVLLNGLDVTIATPDSSGPSVVGSSPESEHSGTLDRIGVTFDELIDASTFTVDVINLSGPSGAIVPTGVNQLTGYDFEIVFDAQSTAGNYTLTLGPDIEDLFGNQMDQDGDGAVGETPEDQYSATITLTPIPFGKHLDFGINGSPVATGYVGVLSNSSYSSAVGHGWLSGTVDSRDRGASAGDALSRDFNFTQLATFVVDVPDAGLYDVTLTMGDGAGYARDQMGVFLEGLQIDSVNSSATAMAVNTYTVEVTDGQLTLLLDDLGGSDLYVLLNGLDITIATPDLSGPSVVGNSPESEHSGSLDRIGVTFDESIDASTFTVADVINLSGPSGAIVPTGVNQLTGSDFEIVFDSQSTLGDYTLTLGPDIEDLFGNQMDQDGDGAVGETPEDQYSTTIALTPAPFEKHLDFGKNRSPVAAGYEGVVSNSNYSSAVGHGWLSGTVGSRDRGVSAGDALSRDFNFTKFATFVVDVPAAGFYDVTLTMGDGRASTPLRDEMGVFLEGLQVDSVASQPGEYVTTVYQVAVSDGQLTLLLDDLGGSDLYVIINGMSVTSAEAAAAAIAPSLATKTRKSASLVAVQLASDAQPLRTMHSVGESTSQSGRRGLPRYAKPLLAIEQFFTTLANSAVQSSRTRGMGAADVRISAGDSYARALDVVLVDFEKSILVDLL